MKLLAIVSAVAVICAANALRVAKQYEEYSEEDFDWELIMRCRDAMDVQSSCPITEYPLVQKIAFARSPQDMERVLSQTNSQEICDTAVPLANCGLSVLKGIPEECQSIIINERNPFNYDEAVRMAEKLVGILEDTCENDLEFIDDNFECLNNPSLLMITPRCSRFNPCFQYDELTKCVRGVLEAEPSCSNEAADYAIGKLDDIMDVLEPVCSRMPGAGPALMNHLIRRLYK